MCPDVCNSLSSIVCSTRFNQVRLDFGSFCARNRRVHSLVGHIEQLEADLKQNSALVNALERASIVSPTDNRVSNMSESVVAVVESSNTVSNVAAESRIDEAEYDIV